MLIACVNLILQVTHAREGKYKYSRHTVSFPQDISTIVSSLPYMLSDLDIPVVTKLNSEINPMNFSLEDHKLSQLWSIN